MGDPLYKEQDPPTPIYGQPVVITTLARKAALDYAVRSGRREIVEILKARGAGRLWRSSKRAAPGN
jgi:hypothetical protein